MWQTAQPWCHGRGKTVAMPASADTLRLHLDYSEWASRRVLEAASRLTPEQLGRDFSTADRTVPGTLAHIFGADRAWLARVHSEPAVVRLAPEELVLDNLR